MGEALECLDEIEQITDDMDDEIKEAIMEDVNERREEIKDIDRRAAKDFSRMFKAMGDKQVFGEGRFLADGTSPPPALTGKQEREIKRMKDREEYLAGKAKYELEQRRLEGKSTTDHQGEPDTPTP